MKTWRELVAMLRISVPRARHAAMDYLESRGKRFCVDFGHDNAVDLARADWSARKRRSKRKNP